MKGITDSEPTFSFSQSVRFPVLYNKQTKAHDWRMLRMQGCSAFFLCLLWIPHIRNECAWGGKGSLAPLDGQVITEYENMPKLKPQTASLELNPCKCPKWEQEEAIRFHSCRRQACGVRPHAAHGCLPGDSNYSIKTF